MDEPEPWVEHCHMETELKGSLGVSLQQWLSPMGQGAADPTYGKNNYTAEIIALKGGLAESTTAIANSQTLEKEIHVAKTSPTSSAHIMGFRNDGPDMNHSARVWRRTSGMSQLMTPSSRVTQSNATPIRIQDCHAASGIREPATPSSAPTSAPLIAPAPVLTDKLTIQYMPSGAFVGPAPVAGRAPFHPKRRSSARRPILPLSENLAIWAV